MTLTLMGLEMLHVHTTKEDFSDVTEIIIREIEIRKRSYVIRKRERGRGGRGQKGRRKRRKGGLGKDKKDRKGECVCVCGLSLLDSAHFRYAQRAAASLDARTRTSGTRYYVEHNGYRVPGNILATINRDDVQQETSRRKKCSLSLGNWCSQRRSTIVSLQHNSLSSSRILLQHNNAIYRSRIFSRVCACAYRKWAESNNYSESFGKAWACSSIYCCQHSLCHMYRLKQHI